MRHTDSARERARRAWKKFEERKFVGCFADLLHGQRGQRRREVNWGKENAPFRRGCAAGGGKGQAPAYKKRDRMSRTE